MSGITELEKNEEFVKKLSETASPAEAVRLFEEFGVTVTEEEFVSAFREAVSGSDGELNEKALDEVAGGKLYSPKLPVFKCVSKAVKKNLKWLSDHRDKLII